MSKQAINILSVYDGISCGKVALNKVGKKCNYYASEINAKAILVSKDNHPDIIHVGAVEDIVLGRLPIMDAVIGGSPCQGFSAIGGQLNFNDPRSKLVFDYVATYKYLKVKNPDIKFFLENVVMKKEWQDIISNLLGVEPILVNSRLVSAQDRRRLYWTNIEGVQQPEDRGIKLQDILTEGVAHREKSKCLRVGGRGSNDRHEWDIATVDGRRYNRVELERLQGLPDYYTKAVSEAEAYKQLGNGWNVDTIAHFFQYL